MTILLSLFLGGCFDAPGSYDQQRADRPVTAPAPTARAPTTANEPVRAGVVATVKSVDETAEQVVLTVNGRDLSFDTDGLTLGPEIVAGSTVTIDYAGDDLRSIKPGSQTASDL